MERFTVNIAVATLNALEAHRGTQVPPVLVSGDNRVEDLSQHFPNH